MSRKCIFCSNNDEILPVFELSKSFIFNENSLEQCLTLYSYCKICKWSYYPNSYIHNTTRKQYVLRQTFENTNSFYFGGESIYSHRLFLGFSSALLSMCASFHGFAKNYNNLFINKTSFIEKKLDEKNVQINWMIYQILNLLFLWTDRDKIEIPFSLRNKDEVNVFFDRHKNELYVFFVQYWSDYKVHRSVNCTERCTDILIVDGHQKTARSTCKFNNCYDNTIEELGPVLVGCPRSVVKNTGDDL